ncbi:MAG: hypothetical protein DBY36_00100 [Clostridiales bacterium]|nr:MAG: hypothetical protein DBY36_00100 [Clostridiales bacterium]
MAKKKALLLSCHWIFNSRTADRTVFFIRDLPFCSPLLYACARAPARKFLQFYYISEFSLDLSNCVEKEKRRRFRVPAQKACISGGRALSDRARPLGAL